MKNLNNIQIDFLKKISILLVIQLLLLFGIIFLVHEKIPNRTIIFTKNSLLDFFISIIISFSIMISLFLLNDYSSQSQLYLRFILLLLLGFLLSWILSIQYNIMIKRTKNPRETTNNLILSGGFFIILFILVLISLPRLMQYLPEFTKLQNILIFCIFISIIWGLLFGISVLYLVFILIVFLLLLVVDTTLITSECKIQNTMGCDVPTGAMNLYLNMINIIQKTWMLLDRGNSW